MPAQIVSDYLAESTPRLGMEPAFELMVAEANHRIANNLTLIASMVRLQASEVAKAGRPLSAEDVRRMLEEVGERIQTVGRLHRMLAQASGTAPLELNAYLLDIAEAAIGSMAMAGEMFLSREPGAKSGCEAPPNQALLIGFIVGELVTNAVKYAHPSGVAGKISVGCHPRPEGAVLIKVTDDGVGLPDGFDPRRDGGLGMRMVRALADQLGASLTFDAADGVGLTVRLLVPPGSAQA